MANYPRPSFQGLHAKIDNKMRTGGSPLSDRLSSKQLNHDMPNIKGVKHKVDTKGTDLTKLPPSPTKVVHKGLPYNHRRVTPKVESWRYFNFAVSASGKDE